MSFPRAQPLFPRKTFDIENSICDHHYVSVLICFALTPVTAPGDLLNASLESLYRQASPKILSILSIYTRRYGAAVASQFF
jgi:hypothetical protein